MAGIYHNKTLGLISLSSDGENWITISDKNLGATEVYNYGDTLSEANAGKYYQWGNNYGFPFEWNSSSITITSDTVDLSGYGPSTYNSSIFRTAYLWDTSKNANLWGETTNTNIARKGPCDTGFHIPSNQEITSLYGVGTSLGIWGSGNWAGFSSYLKAPLNGYISVINTTKYTFGRGAYAALWSSSGGPYSTNQFRANAISGEDNGPSLLAVNVNYGYSIRPFKNEAVIPDYTWTKLYGDDILPPFLKWFIKNGNYYYFGDAPIHISGLALDKSEITLTTVGQTEQLTATISPEGAVETNIVWSSSDETIATVSQTGLVTCVTPGECTITATCEGYSASCSVTARKDVYADFLLVGGGGAGGGCYNTATRGGGGGAGGFVERFNCLIDAGTYNVVIGAGGDGNQSAMACLYGCPSCFGNIVAYGGGGGGGYNLPGCGASGGGGRPGNAGGCAIHGSQGCNGGAGAYYAGGGGGGAKSVGSAGVCNSATCCGGAGGSGKCSCISGEWQRYSGGGGGAGWCCGGCGGCGGGGNGARSATGCGCSATYYGGGGGGGFNRAYSLGSGCQGVFIFRYPTACGYDVTGGTKYICGDYTIHCFTSNGTLTVN